MTSLSKIITPESIVLMDAGMMDCGHCFAREIYEISHYDEANTKTLEKANRCMDYSLELLRNENVFTIPEVSKENWGLEQIIAEKIRNCGKGFAHPNGHGKKEKIERANKNEHLFRTLQEKCYDICRLSERKQLNFEDDGHYGLLLEMVKKIENKLGLKVDTSYLAGITDTPNTHNSDTDERLVAGLFYLSMFSDKKPSLIGVDGDLTRLGGIIPTLIGAEDLMPLNGQFREALKENPFNIYYYQGDGNFQHDVESSGISYLKEFLLDGIKRNENDFIRGDMRFKWKSFIELG